MCVRARVYVFEATTKLLYELIIVGCTASFYLFKIGPSLKYSQMIQFFFQLDGEETSDLRYITRWKGRDKVEERGV